MFNPSVLSIITGISSLYGLLGLLAYLYFSLQNRKTELSIRDIIEGEGPFTAIQVIDVLKEFKNDADRLIALQHLSRLDIEKSRALLEKVRNNIDVNKLQNLSTTRKTKIIILAQIFFATIAVIASLYYNKPFPLNNKIPEADVRFDVDFSKAKFLAIDKNRIRSEIVLQAKPLTTINKEIATIFVGIITIHDESRIDLSKETLIYSPRNW